MASPPIHTRVAAVAERLPDAPRRVADLVLKDPETVAFGTVASVAALAETSAPTVVRLATSTPTSSPPRSI